MNHFLRRNEVRPRPTRLAGCLLLAATLCFSLQTTQAQTAKRNAAHAQYEKAEKLRAAVEGKPQKDRTERDYVNLIAAYRRVYQLSPQATETTSALLAVAELYQQMGRQFGKEYFQSSIDAYQFLLHEYPSTRYRDEALFTIAEIQRNDLDDGDLAEKNYEEFLKRYPKSRMAEQARDALAQIAAEREKARRAAAAPAPKSPEALPASSPVARDGRMPQLTSIRHWNAENYTRIVVNVEDKVQYRAERIANPDRIYFDVYKAKLSSTLSGKQFDVQNGLLKTIRVAQNQIGVVRIVLEVERVKDYTVFFLPDPHRMVVDIFGENLSTAKAEPTKSEPAKAEVAKAEPAKAEPKAESKHAASKNEPPKKEAAKAETKSEPRKETAARNEPAPLPAAKETAKETEKEAESPVPARGGKGNARGAAATPAAVPHPTRNGQMSITRALGLKIGRIVIDAGHGGHDTGTIGPTGLMEKDLCLDVAQRLGRLIEEKIPGTEIVYTREEDVFVPLENRTAIANQARADIFISIHANSSREASARGIETYYLNFAASPDAMEVAARENALSQSSINELQDLLKRIARNEKIEESRELAAEIQDSLAKRLQRVSKANKNRGVKKAPFVVLIGANMPSVLAEVSFLSNPSDEAMLKKPEHRARVAEGLFKGIERYLTNLNSLTYAPRRGAPGEVPQ